MSTNNDIANRITELAGNVKQQLIQKSHEFETFSIALEESTDVCDTSHCAVFIRGVDVNLNITEELLDVVPLMGTTRRVHRKAALPWNKLISLGMGSAPAMYSASIGAVGLLKSKLNSHTTPQKNVTSIHVFCIKKLCVVKVYK